MLRKSLIGLVCILITSTLAIPVVFAKKTPPPSVEYYPFSEYELQYLIDSGSVLVMEADTGRVIFDVDGYSRRYPASVTKVMTAILVLENIYDLNEIVNFSARSVDLPWYAARMWMKEGETLTVRDALYAIMLSSGNDVARALAEHVSGSIDTFVDKMNSRAVEIGAYNTRFVNPCGLPGDNQYITAYDIALIMKEAIKIPIFVETISTAYYSFPATYEHPGGRVIHNTHRMIRQFFEYEYDPRIIGGKTGFTNAAQHTLVSYAKYNEFGLIISVLYSPNRTIFTDTRILMDYAFGILSHERAEELRIEQEQLMRELLELEKEHVLQSEQYTERVNNPISKYLPLTYESISDAEALAIAASSLGLALLSLGIIKLIYSRKDY